MGEAQKPVVEAHSLVDPDPEGELEFLEELLSDFEEYAARVRPSLGGYFRDAQRALGYRFALGHSREAILASLRDVVDFGTALFRRAEYCPADMVEIVIRGTKLELPGGLTDRATSAPAWIATTSAALTLRDAAALESLLRFDQRAVEGDYDGYFDDYVAALRSWLRGDGDTRERLARALTATANARIYPVLALHVGAPLVRVAQAIFERDQAGYAELLYAGLVSYRELYETPAFSHEASNVVPLRYLGLCAMASDRGLECPVDSGYLPEWLVTRT